MKGEQYENSSNFLFLTWPVAHQRMAFYAGVYVPKVGFTLSHGEVSEWKALIQDGIDYEATLSRSEN